MKKLFCVLALLLVLPRAGAVSARAAVVIDADTGETLFEQNADSRLPMASTTKIMTALVALGEGDLDRVYTVKPEYAAVEGSSMYLKAGETLSLQDTLYGLMLASGNDAAVAIAGECGGMTAFVGKMNAKAAELGLTDTHFDNPNGLPSDTHYTTAHELAKITAAALKDPVFRQIVSTKSCTVSGHALSNHNRLLSMYDGAIGVKTGFTRAAGRCLVSAAERNGRTIIAVTLNDPNDWNDHREMLDAGFAQYSEVTLHKAGHDCKRTRVRRRYCVRAARGEEYRDGVSAARREREAAARALRRKNLLCTGREDGTGGFGRISARGLRLGTRYAGLRRGIAASGGRKILR